MLERECHRKTGHIKDTSKSLGNLKKEEDGNEVHCIMCMLKISVQNNSAPMNHMYHTVEGFTELCIIIIFVLLKLGITGIKMDSMLICHWSTKKERNKYS